MNSPTTRRPRRSSADIRALILASARELFLEHGYDGTTTRQICEHAGVVEPLLFTNFGSKAELFEQAMLAPVSRWVDEYASSFADAEASPQDRTAAFVQGLFTIAESNRPVLLAALHQRQGRGTAESDLVSNLATTLRGLVGVSDLTGYPGVDPEATTVAALGMVLGVALLDDLVATDADRPDRARLLAAMESLLYFGTTRQVDS